MKKPEPGTREHCWLLALLTLPNVFVNLLSSVSSPVTRSLKHRPGNQPLSSTYSNILHPGLTVSIYKVLININSFLRSLVRHFPVEPFFGVYACVE